MRPTMIPRAALLLAMLASTGDAQARWQLVEDLRIGGDEQEATMFTSVRSIVAGPEGHIFVLDARPQEIRLFDRTGKFITLAARKGQGPGEIAGANGLLVLRDTVWANDPNNGRWSAWSAVNGKHARQLTISIRSYGFLWEAGADAEGRIIDPVSIRTNRVDARGRPVSERRLRRVRTDGTADTIPFPECQQRNPPAMISFSGENPNPGPGQSLNMFTLIPFQPRPLFAFDGQGGLWCAPNDEYVLVRMRLGGSDTLQTVRRQYTRLSVPRAERDSAIAQTRKSLAEFKVVTADYSLIPTSHPVFTRLDVDDRGQLWARRTTQAGSPSGFDVFDSSGRMVATVASTVRFAPNLPVHIRADHVYGVVLGEDDTPQVVRARIVRSGSGSGR